MSTEPTPLIDLLRRHRDLLEHFHANDPNQLGPGMGKLDFRPIFKTLAEIGYRGWISVEVFDYALGGERIARQSIDYMKQCLP
jgi:sugar phosphate isomerase/epimerase